MRSREEILRGKDIITFFMECRASFKYFCEEMLKYTSNGMELKIQPFQERWVRLAETNTRLVVEAATGLSKTETMCVLYPLWVMFKSKHIRIIAVSPTKDQTKGNILERIKVYIRENQILKEMFVPNDEATTWNQSEFKTKQGHWFRVTPYSSRIRGYRANLILFDEFDDAKEVNTYFEDVVTRLLTRGRIILTTTPKMNAGILAELRERSKSGKLTGYCFEKTPVLVKPDGKPAYTCPPENVTYEMLEDCVSIWEEQHPREEVLRGWHEQGKWNFMKNRMCEVIGTEDNVVFPFPKIISSIDFNLSFDTTTRPDAVYSIGIDFATSEGARADYTFLTVVEKWNGKYIIKYADWFRGKDDEFVKEVVRELYQKFENGNGTFVIADSSNAGNLFIKKITSIGIPVVEQKFAQAHRNNLFTTLATVLKGGHLIIPKNFEDKSAEYCEILKNQLVGFTCVTNLTGSTTYKPGTTHDDSVVSLAMAVKELTQYEYMEDITPLYGN